MNTDPHVRSYSYLISQVMVSEQNGPDHSDIKRGEWQGKKDCAPGWNTVKLSHHWGILENHQEGRLGWRGGLRSHGCDEGDTNHRCLPTGVCKTKWGPSLVRTGGRKRGEERAVRQVNKRGRRKIKEIISRDATEKGPSFSICTFQNLWMTHIVQSFKKTKDE